MLLLQQLYLLLVIALDHLHFPRVRRFDFIRHLLHNILHVHRIALECHTLLREGVVLLSLPLGPFVIHFGVRQHRNVLLHVLAVHVPIDVVQRCHLLLVLREESLGKRLEQTSHDILGGVVLHGQVNGQSALHVAAARGLGIRVQNLRDQVVRRPEHQCGMERQGAESELRSLLLTAGHDPSLALLGELHWYLVEHLFSVGELTSLESLEEVGGILVVVDLGRVGIEPLLPVLVDGDRRCGQRRSCRCHRGRHGFGHGDRLLLILVSIALAENFVHDRALPLDAQGFLEIQRAAQLAQLAVLRSVGSGGVARDGRVFGRPIGRGHEWHGRAELLHLGRRRIFLGVVGFFLDHRLFLYDWDNYGRGLRGRRNDRCRRIDGLL
mmetsp:Transcript_18592/g.33513  ORF Transcript_18592/g.33513 Transcript_18592/m.33513 type:complete len:381 (-) Transcript_18592:259-1401(-)